MLPINPKTSTIIKHISEGRSAIVQRIPPNSPFLGHFLAAAIRSPSPLSPNIAVAIIGKGLNTERVNQVFLRAASYSEDTERDRTFTTISEIERLLKLKETQAP